MYHSLSRVDHHLCVAPEMFEEHCRTLAQAGWRGVSLEEAENYFLKNKRLPRKSCLFTFDDGYLDNYVYAEPLLRRYGHCGVIFPVLGLMDKSAKLRPNLDELERDPGAEKRLPQLDTRATAQRGSRRVSNIIFCNWAELAHMRDKGTVAAAPHSMHHGRVVRSLKIKRFYMPHGRSSFFAVPPHDMPLGFPCFELGHALSDMAYTIDGAVFDLIRRMVPQTAKEAAFFLRQPENRKAILQELRKLPSLGKRESEKEYRVRIAKEFRQCRELFMEKMGCAPVSFCWPWGSYNPIALQEAREAGFRLFFATFGKPGIMNTAKAVHRISVRRQNGTQLLQRLRFSSGAIGEGLLGLFGQ